MRGRKGRIFGIVPMTGELAAKIAAWEYPGEYAVYNWDEGSPVDELLDGSSYALLNSARELAGFYQFGAGARIPTVEEGAYSDGPLDIGLGLRPDLCGLGFGEPFVQCGIRLAREELGACAVRLTVAGFNIRARRVYERCGFKTVGPVTHKVSNAQFFIMLL